MPPKSNIEVVARDICSKQLSRLPISDDKRAADIDRYWHCTAAQLESGQIELYFDQFDLQPLFEEVVSSTTILDDDDEVCT